MPLYRRFRHKKKILFISPIVIFLVLGPGLIFERPATESPTVSLEPRVIAVDPGQEFTINITVNSKRPVNAFDVRLDFPTEQLDALFATASDSIIDLWISKPAVQNASGTVTMAGGSTKQGGWRGVGTISTVTFRAKKTGPAVVRVGSAIVLAHDGKGTNAAATTTGADLTVRPVETGGTDVISAHTDTTYLIRSESSPTTDLNSDGKTTLADLSAFMSRNEKSYEPVKDFNQDGAVNIRDMSILFSAVIR